MPHPGKNHKLPTGMARSDRDWHQSEREQGCDDPVPKLQRSAHHPEWDLEPFSSRCCLVDKAGGNRGDHNDKRKIFHVLIFDRCRIIEL
jgi:hypothetical protein